MNRTRRTAAASLLFVSMALAGCSAGHGNYTQQFKEEAQSRMSRVRAATQHDMALQQFLSGELDKALKTVEGSIALKDDVAKSHVLRGRVFLERGNLDSAQDSFQRALLIDESFAQAHYYLGIIDERFNRMVEAIERFETAHELDGTDAQYVVALAETLIELGDLDAASSLLEESKSQFELNPALHQTLGHIAMMRGEYERAVTSFNEAHLLTSGVGPILEDLARAQLSAGRFAEAEYSLSRLMENKENKDRRDLRLLWARTLTELDRPVEARGILRELLRQPGGGKDVKAWIQLGSVSWMLGDDRDLRAAGNRLSTIAPKRYEGPFLLGLWNMRRGDLRRASEHLEDAVALAPSSPAPRLMLGVAYERMGRRAEATETLERAMRLHPDDERASALLARVRGVQGAGDGLAVVPEGGE